MVTINIVLFIPIVTRWQLIRRGEIDHGSQEGVQGGGRGGHKGLRGNDLKMQDSTTLNIHTYIHSEYIGAAFILR